MLRLLTAAALLTASTAANAAVISFGPTSSTASGALISFDNLTAPTGIVGDATINFTVKGDLNSNYEYIDITLDGFSLGRVFDNNTGNDPFDFTGDVGSYSTETGSATITNSDMAALIADGFLSLSFDFSSAVNCCGPVNLLQGTISYDTIAPVPLPASGLLLFASLGGFAFLRRKKKA
ncbi:VPLPA-CTERM sorting domain-containing protein [Sedimentitalea sp. CY04]|uniref:VPLPA-CTERM sorting domain-containing protein n=1 Tax=Parasedimentitalea denitrificans TaxID=2211118 RepID=A0ABX0W7L8_9RHOB|nr:VPLPA-CTERM sorting domain-containing protein [Sedimentitalea sp. CY04]NIZ61604.1 VPLPA-CTERM sorting domain-containing protein [Sedimentitalea sp. CY04]